MRAWSVDRIYTQTHPHTHTVRVKGPHSTERLQAMMKTFSLTTKSMKIEHMLWPKQSVGAERSSPDRDKLPKEKLGI